MDFVAIAESKSPANAADQQVKGVSAAQLQIETSQGRFLTREPAIVRH